MGVVGLMAILGQSNERLRVVSMLVIPGTSAESVIAIVSAALIGREAHVMSISQAKVVDLPKVHGDGKAPI